MKRQETRWLGIMLTAALCAGAAWAQAPEAEEGFRADERTDLSAISLESSIPYPMPGETVEIRLRVRNNGMVPVAKAEVRLLADGAPSGTAVLKLAPGETGTVRFPWTPAAAKAYALTATIDPAARLPERDRLDDTATAEVIVAAQPAPKHPEAALAEREVRAPRDLRVEGLSVSATPPETGRARRFTVSFRIVNHGRDAVTAPFRTSVFPGAVNADGKTLEPFIVTSAGLPVGQSLYVSRTIALPQDIHQIEARVETDLDQAPGSTITPNAAGRVAVAPFENPVANVGRWVSIGPRGIPEGLGAVGVLFSIAVDPVSPATIYVGSHGSGVWKTTDGGASWSPITDSLPTLKVAALAIDPAQTARIYVATPDFGVFRSEDGGTSWNQVSGAAHLNLTNCCDTLIVDPNHAGGLYLSSFNGIYHSTDSGANWTLSLAAGQATSLVMDLNRPGLLYAAVEGSGITLNKKGIYRAALGGDSWSLLTGCPGGQMPAFDPSARITLALSGSKLYAGFRTKTTFQLARTTGVTCQVGFKPGLQWLPLWNPSNDTFGGDPVPALLWNGIYADPADSRFVYATGTQFWASTDGGVTFNVRSGPHTDHHGFATDPGTPGKIYTVCDGGIYQASDPAANSWKFLGDGIFNMEFYDVANAPSDPNLMIGGTQDNGTQRYKGSSTEWDWVDGGDGGTVAIDPTNSQVLYAMNQNAPSVARSANGGGSWTGIAQGLPTGSVCFNLQWYPHPTKPSILIASCLNSLWRTPKVGMPWLAILTVPSGEVLRSAVDSSIDLYYAGTSLGQVFAGPGGGGWQQVFAHPGARGITDLKVDLDDKPTLYAAFTGTGAGRVYRLRRGSPVPQTMSALDITADLPSTLQIRALAVDRAAAWTVYAGTDAGVFKGRSSDGVTWHWTSYNNGLPPAVIINKLEVHPTSGTLRAGTFGRSAYEVNTDFPIGSLVSIEGKITLLRMEDVGTGYGPPTDSIDVEAVIWLDSVPGKAFGFQIRKDAGEAERTKMFDLLRDAFEANRTIRIDYTRTGLRNGIILRVADLP